MTTLILCRHGETESNAAQIYQGQGNGMLTKKGLRQAKTLEKTLSGFKIDSVYSSDLQRAFDTASMIAKSRGKQVKIDPRLKERFYGEWEGLNFDKIVKDYNSLYKTWMKNPAKARIPAAETLKELQKRGMSGINSIIKRNKGKNVLVVAHGGINRTILFSFLGIDLNYFWRLKQDNCCINVIVIDDKTGVPKVLLVNYTPLDGEKFQSFNGNIY